MKPIHLAIVVAATLLPAGAGAQSLADAARRAEEARKTASGGSRLFTNKDLKTVPGDEQRLVNYELTIDNLMAMMSASRALTRIGDPELGRRLQMKIEAANSLDELVGVFETEPVVARTIAANGLSPRDFLMTGTVLSVALALIEKPGAQPYPDPMPAMLQKNLEFVKAHWEIIQAYQSEKRARGQQQ